MKEVLKKITVATDLSDRSDRAVLRAFALAQKHGAALTVFHVVDADLPDDMENVMLGEARANAERFVSGLGHGARAEVVCIAGDPVEEIINVARGDLDLLVVGVHRARPFLDALRETTVQKTVRHAPCTVLLVKGSPEKDYGTVLYPTDFSPASKAAVEAAAAVAPEAKLCPLSALQVPYSGRLARSPGLANQLEASFRREAKASAKVWLSSLDVAAERLEEVTLTAGGAISVIHGAVTEYGADLIALGAHGRAGVMLTLLGSVANDLIRDPPCDLLIAR